MIKVIISVSSFSVSILVLARLGFRPARGHGRGAHRGSGGGVGRLQRRTGLRHAPRQRPHADRHHVRGSDHAGRGLSGSLLSDGCASAASGLLAGRTRNPVTQCGAAPKPLTPQGTASMDEAAGNLSQETPCSVPDLVIGDLDSATED